MNKEYWVSEIDADTRPINIRNDPCPVCHYMWNNNCPCMKEKVCARGHRFIRDKVRIIERIITPIENSVKTMTVEIWYKEEKHPTNMSIDDLIREIDDDPHFQREKELLIKLRNKEIV
jgi:hypothetical protein